MRHMMILVQLLVIFLLGLTLEEQSMAQAPKSLAHYIHRSGTAVGRQTYLGALRVPSALGKVFARVPWAAKRLRQRQIIQVTNQTLEQYVHATGKGYLEVIIPASGGTKGHVYFRHGNEVFDFYPGGFRVGGVRPIKSERYGMLVPLSGEQEKRLGAYLARLKGNGGRELGEYDFSGESGFHCVSWLMRAPLSSKGENLAQLLGQKSGAPGGIVRFSRFMLKKAQPVDAVTIYRDEPSDARSLSKATFDFITRRQLGRAFAEGSFH